jgi:hypothetical protein
MLLPLAPAAMAETVQFTPQQLDQMAQDRQQEIGPRNWGPPPKVSGKPVQTHPTPVPVYCASPIRDYEPVYAEPSAQSRQIGLAASEIAVTHEVRGGWRKILRAGHTFGWIPNADVGPYKSLPGTTPNRCVVAGESASGMVMFNYIAE